MPNQLQAPAWSTDSDFYIGFCALERQACRTCIQSVSHGDALFEYRLRERGQELYAFITGDKPSQPEAPPAVNGNTEPLAA